METLQEEDAALPFADHEEDATPQQSYFSSSIMRSATYKPVPTTKGKPSSQHVPPQLSALSRKPSLSIGLPQIGTPQKSPAAASTGATAIFIPGFRKYVNKASESYANSTSASPNHQQHQNSSATFQMQLLKTISSQDPKYQQQSYQHQTNGLSRNRKSKSIAALAASHNEQSPLQTNIKESSHEIQKLVYPLAHKDLRIKQTRNSLALSTEQEKLQQQPTTKIIQTPYFDYSVILPQMNTPLTEKTFISQYSPQKISTLKDIVASQGSAQTIKQSDLSILRTGVLAASSSSQAAASPGSMNQPASVATPLSATMTKQLNTFLDRKNSRVSLLQTSNNNTTYIPPSLMPIASFNDKQSASDAWSASKANSNTSMINSALLSAEKVGIIKEMNARNPESKVNFYGQFISKCLQRASSDIQNASNSKKKGTGIFEKDLEKIKVSSLLLDVIDKQIFAPTSMQSSLSDGLQKPEDALSTEEDQGVVQMKSSTIKQSSSTAASTPLLNSKQKEKLFSVLADAGKVVVHTAQNKDLMVPSERKDVVRLAGWLEEMLNRIYETDSLDFYSYFENVQLVCSACMSELIRQVSVSVSERGTLVKRVWESMLSVMKQGFEQLTSEKVENEDALRNEIKSIHRMYLKQLDEYIPTIESLTKKLEQKELQNKRVVLEFRYLRKKDAKLEKYLRMSKKDIRSIEEEYAKLERQYKNLKSAIDRQEIINNAGQGGANGGFDEAFLQQVKAQEVAAEKLKRSFNDFSENFDKNQKDIIKLQDRFAQDVKSFHSNSMNGMKADAIDQIEEDIYARREVLDSLLRMDERIIEEINGNDGIKLIIGHCGVQVGPDLLKMTHQSVDTSTLYQVRERTTQTFTPGIDVKEIQTPVEWMNYHHVGLKSPTGKHATTGKQQGRQISESIAEIEEVDEIDMEQRRNEIEAVETLKLEQMKRVEFRNEEEETEENRQLYELPFVRDFINDSPMLQKSGMIFDWKTSGEEADKKDHDPSSLTKKVKQVNDAGVQRNDEKDDDVDEHVNDDDEESAADATFNNNSNQVQQQQQQMGSAQKVKIPESISQAIRNNVEKDLEALHTLVMSRTSFVIKIFEKIVQFDLLKENPHVSASLIDQFVADSKQLIFEEHNRLSRIYQRSKRGIIDQVKSRLLIAEKDVELQEIQNDRLVFEHQIKQYRRTIVELEDGKLESISSFSEQQQQLQQQQHQRKHRASQSINSMEDLSEEMGNGEEDDDNSDESSDGDDNNMNGSPKSASSINYATDAIKIDLNSPQKSRKSSKQTDILSKQISSSQKKSVSIEKVIQTPSTTTNKQQLNTSGTSPVQPGSTLSAPNNNRKHKKKETLNPLNRVSISLIHAVQSQKQQSQQQMLQSQQQQQSNTAENNKHSNIPTNTHNNTDSIEKRFTELHKKNSHHHHQSSSSSASNQSSQLQWLSRIIASKNRQSISSSVQQSSPNADSAAFFFNHIAVRFVNGKEGSRAGTNSSKKVIMKQQNVLRHIANIYIEKIKSVKNEEESGCARTLNIVTYDYFLNQFGFKKLAETKLKQFLDSCDYYSVTFKIRMFTKLYGINRIMNYDFSDFDFFARVMIFLEEGATPAQITANIYPLNRAVEALYRNFEGKIPAAELIRLKTDVENMKKADSTQKQKNKFAIDIDHALDILLQALVEEKKMNLQNLQSVYLAGDINGEQVISYDAFQMLYRHFEATSFESLAVTRYYYLHCDLLDRYTGARAMSFSQFALESMQNNLFTKETQESYANRIEQFDRIKNIEMLEKLWDDKKDVIRLRFVMNQSYSVLYKQMITKIDDYFARKKEARKVHDKNTTWFMYRLLDDESKRVMIDGLVGQLIPQEMNAFGSVMQTFVQKIVTI